MELHRLDCSSSHNMLDNYDFIRGKQRSSEMSRLPRLRYLRERPDCSRVQAGAVVLASARSGGRRPARGPHLLKMCSARISRGYERASFGTSIHLRTPRG